MNDRWIYASMEWMWQESAIRINVPQQQEWRERGSYQDVVEILSRLGMQGWEVVTCVAGGDWVYWTLKRPAGVPAPPVQSIAA
jgi:hypothetical protein